MKLLLETMRTLETRERTPSVPGSVPASLFSDRRHLAAETPVPMFLEQAVQGCHLRAARALLGWPMPVLAASGALSVSTVKRLEDGRDPQPTRSRRKAIGALRRAGIRFVMLDDGSVAVAKLQAVDPL